MPTFQTQLLVPNSEGLLFGRERKPKPFRVEVIYEGDNIAEAFAAQGQHPSGKAGVRVLVDGKPQTLRRGEVGWDEYAVLVYKNTGRRI